MEPDVLTPWYALENDVKKQTLFNRPESVVTIIGTDPRLHTPTRGYRSALDVIMELTVKVRKDLDGSVPFEWPDDLYHTLCISWYEEQKNQGIKEIAFLHGEDAEHIKKDTTRFCMVCWYADGRAAGYVPSQEDKDGVQVPVILQVEMTQADYRKPEFTENYQTFRVALQGMADLARDVNLWEWQGRFEEGVAILEKDDVEYSGQDDVFPIPKPYFKYLLAAQTAKTGSGMGSWFDLPMAGTSEFKLVTNRYLAEQSKALMYAINNC